MATDYGNGDIRPKIYEMKFFDRATWEDLHERQWLINNMRSQGYDIIRFGGEILWESEQWKEIKEHLNGKT